VVIAAPGPPRALIEPEATGERTMNELQRAVHDVYVMYDESADAIVCDPDVALCFVAEVNDRLTQRHAARDVMRCLLNLRKRGMLPLKSVTILTDE
jgi:hypothetical protein